MSNHFESVSTQLLLNQAHDIALQRRLQFAKHDDAYWKIVHRLRQRPEDGALKQAINWCRSPNGYERELGVDILAQLNHSWKEPSRPFENQVMPILLDRLSDVDHHVLGSTIHALGFHFIDDVNRILQLAEHESEDVRFAVAASVASAKNGDSPEAIRTILKLMEDEDKDVRNYATFQLALMENVDSAEIREALYNATSDAYPEVRGEALRGLALRKDERTAEGLMNELARGEIDTVVYAAAEALGDVRLLPSLVEWLDHPPIPHGLKSAIESLRERS